MTFWQTNGAFYMALAIISDGSTFGFMSAGCFTISMIGQVLDDSRKARA